MFYRAYFFSLVVLALLLAPPVSASVNDSGFFITGSGKIFMMDGTGTWNGDKFDLANGWNDDPWGYNLGNTDLWGFKTTMGFRFNRRFGLGFSWSYFPTFETSEYLEAVNMDNDLVIGMVSSELSNDIAEILLYFYPKLNSSLNFFAGLRTHDFELLEKIDWSFGDHLLNPYDDGIAFFREEERAWGFALGTGYEFSVDENSILFFAAQYNLVNFSDEDWGSLDYDWDMNASGFEFEAGLKIFVPEILVITYPLVIWLSER